MKYFISHFSLICLEMIYKIFVYGTFCWSKRINLSITWRFCEIYSLCYITCYEGLKLEKRIAQTKIKNLIEISTHYNVDPHRECEKTYVLFILTTWSHFVYKKSPSYFYACPTSAILYYILTYKYFSIELPKWIWIKERIWLFIDTMTPCRKQK